MFYNSNSNDLRISYVFDNGEHIHESELDEARIVKEFSGRYYFCDVFSGFLSVAEGFQEYLGTNYWFYCFDHYVPSIATLFGSSEVVRMSLNHSVGTHLELTADADVLRFDILRKAPASGIEEVKRREFFRTEDFLREWELMLLRVERIESLVVHGSKELVLPSVRISRLEKFISPDLLEYTMAGPINEVLKDPTNGR